MNKNITVDMSVRMTIDVFLLVLLVSSNLIVELVLVYDGGRIKLFGFGIIAIFSIDYFSVQHFIYVDSVFMFVI